MMLKCFKVAVILAVLNNTLNIIYALMMDNWDEFYYSKEQLQC
jgi:hypothetical protein